MSHNVHGEARRRGMQWNSQNQSISQKSVKKSVKIRPQSRPRKAADHLYHDEAAVAEIADRGGDLIEQ